MESAIDNFLDLYFCDVIAVVPRASPIEYYICNLCLHINVVSCRMIVVMGVTSLIAKITASSINEMEARY